MHFFLLSLLLLQGAPARNGVLAGQLRAIDGSPASGVRVAAVVVPPANQTQEPGLVPLQYVPPPAALIRTAITDSAGRYRLENVPPGRYYVMAGLTDAPSYYPNSKTAAAATVITVDPGSRAETVNFALQWPLGIRVRGRVISTGAQAAGAITATLSGSRVDEFLEVPVESNGAFEFVRVPVGSFTLSLFPPPPGFRPIGVTVVDKDVSGIELVLPPTQTITGRLAIEGDGPLPAGLLSFSTPLNHVIATVNSDGSFKAVVHEGRHLVDVSGLPVGYRVTSVRVGSVDASRGISVEKADVSGVVVTLGTSRPLPRVSGRVTGLSNPGASMKVELRGRHIVLPLAAPIRADGAFDFPKVLPGLYELSLSGVPGFAPTPFVVTNQTLSNVEVTANQVAR